MLFIYFAGNLMNNSVINCKSQFIINSFITKIRMEADWQFPQKKQYPLSITFSPKLTDNSEYFINPFLGYPNCPLIGRYNRGQYKIGEKLLHVEFKCQYSKNTELYHCGERVVLLPQVVHHNLRNIPEIIHVNKPQNLKKVPDFLPEKYPVIDQLSVIWIISFGELGQDFLNYLNHMYILANTLFQQDKLPRQVHYLPIYAYLPSNSGINHNQVEKGLNFRQFRAQYMSFHLSKGAPAFSPNNMRLGIEGGKIVTSKKPPQKKQAKKGNKNKKYVEKQQEEKKKQQDNVDNKLEEYQQFNINWDQIEQKSVKPTIIEKVKQDPKQLKQQKHQGFVHFYTSVLLQNDYRVYYHWHIEDHHKEDLIKEIFTNSLSIEDFLQKYCNVVGKDSLFLEINHLLYPQNS